MSKIALAPNGSGTGTFTLASPNSNTNRTITLPDSDGELLTSSPIKAWVNFNGLGTVAIKASVNVSSVTDLGVGRYRVNFTTGLADVNFAYSIQGSGASPSTTGFSYCAELQGYTTKAAGSLSFGIGYPADNATKDLSDITVIIVR